MNTDTHDNVFVSFSSIILQEHLMLPSDITLKILPIPSKVFRILVI
jgi:hypothetical protein